MLMGKARTFSMKERAASTPMASRLFLTGISFTSPRKNLVTSTTGAPSAAKASTGNAIMIVGVFIASTARLMGSLGSAMLA